MESGDQATYAETSSYEPHGELRRLKVEGEGGLGVFGLPSFRPAAKGGENPAHMTHYGRDDSRSAVPSVMREYRKPPKQGDPIVTLGGQPPTYRKSPRITLPKRSSQPSRMQTRSPGSPAAPGSLR